MGWRCPNLLGMIAMLYLQRAHNHAADTGKREDTATREQWSTGQCQTNAIDITSRHHAPDQRVPMTLNKNRQHGQRTATHLIDTSSSKSREAQLALTRSRSPSRAGQRS